MKKWLNRNPAGAYFVLTFIISWIGIVVVSLFLGMPTTSDIFSSYGVYALIPFLLGPASVALFAIQARLGKQGFLELRGRLLKWKVSPKYYLFALGTIPVFVAVWLMILNQFSDTFMPECLMQESKLAFIMTGALTGLIGGGILEELGWTGYATPLLRKSRSILMTGLTLGFLWGLWHLLPVFWASGDAAGNLSWASFLPGLFSHYAVLIPFRVIQVWLHDQTGSMIPTMIFHSTLTAFALFIFRIVGDGVAGLVYYAGISVYLWSIVGILYKTGQLSSSDSRRDTLYRQVNEYHKIHSKNLREERI